MSQPTTQSNELSKAEIDEQILWHYLEIDSKGNFVSAPGMSVRHLPPDHPERIRVENDELDEFIQVALHFKIPRKVVQPGNQSPFDMVADLFYERVKNALAFANRTGGKTRGVSILNFLDALFKRDCEVASAGAVLDQASKCYKYFSKYIELKWVKQFCKIYHRVTGKKFIIKSIQSSTEFGNGSSVEILTGTEKGLRSPHPNKMRIDEVDLMPWSLLQTGLSMAQSSDTVRGQNVFFSTRQNAKGSMQRLLDTAGEKNITVYQWNVWEILERCTRRCKGDPKHGDCSVFDFCKGKAHHCAGYYKIDDFVEKVKVLDQDTFDTEWLNLKPSKAKLVYPKFDAIHIMTPEKLRALTQLDYPSMYWPRISSLDFGAAPGHPFVYLKLCQLPNCGFWLVFFEVFQEQETTANHAAAIKASPFWYPGEISYADWSAQERVDLKKMYGIRTQPAAKDVNSGIMYVKELINGYQPLNVPALYIWYECRHTIDQLSDYQWAMKADGTPDVNGNPKKINDDCPDALRYALYSNKSAIRQRYTSRSMAGI